MIPIDRIIDIETIYGNDKRLMNMLFLLRNDLVRWMRDELKSRDEARRVARVLASAPHSTYEWSQEQCAALDVALAYPEVSE